MLALAAVSWRLLLGWLVLSAMLVPLVWFLSSDWRRGK